MKYIHPMINDYASADESARVHLFLAHPELREGFLTIDLESARSSKHPSTVAKSSWKDRLLRILPPLFQIIA